MIIEIADRDLGRFGLKIVIRLILMKFDTQNKLSMQIMNVLIGVDGLDLKLKIYEICSQKWNVLQFFWNLALRVILNYEYQYITMNWWPWPNIKDWENLVQTLKFVPISIKFGMIIGFEWL